MDIYSVKDFVMNELSLVDGVIGTGINTSTNSIIIYVNLENNTYVIDEVYNKIGAKPYGFGLQFITTGNLKFI